MSIVQSAPMSTQIAETIKARIRRRELNIGDPLPSGTELEKAFGVSNITIRRAVEILVNEGFIRTGRGVPPKVVKQFNTSIEIEISGDFQAWLNSHTLPEYQLEFVLIGKEKCKSDLPLAKHFLLEGEDKTIGKIQRVLKRKGTPVSYAVNYASYDLIEELTHEKLEDTLFIEAFRSVSDINVSYMEQHVTGIAADIDLAKRLEVPYGFPLFFCDYWYFAKDKSLLAVSHIYYRTDYYTYKIRREIS